MNKRGRQGNLQSNWSVLIALAFFSLPTYGSTAIRHATIPALTEFKDVLQSELNTNTNWTFIPEGQSTALPVKIGVPLNFVLPSSLESCNGIYRIEVPFKKEWIEAFKNESLGLFLPAMGGLKEIGVNGHIMSLPISEYSSTGPIVPLLAKDLNENKLILTIRIISERTIHAGSWGAQTLALDRVPNLILKRDWFMLHQFGLPLLESITLFLLALVIVKTASGIEARPEYLKDLLWSVCGWAVYFLYLAGIARYLFPMFGSATHIPARSFADLGIFRFFYTLSGGSKRTKQYLTFFALLLICIQVLSGCRDIATAFIQLTGLLIINVMQLIAILHVRRHYQTKLERLLFIFGLISVVGFFNDWTKRLLEGLNYTTPFLFITRYTTPPLLFAMFSYSIFRLASETAKRLKRSAAEEVALQVAHDIRSPVAALGVAIQNLDQMTPSTKMLIKAATNRVNEIADSLLAQYKVEGYNDSSSAKGTRTSPTLTQTSLLKVVELVQEILSEKTLLDLNERQIVMEIGETLRSDNGFTHIDASQFKRILSNIINNSIEATDDGRLIRVSIEINKYIQGKRLQIIIQDNGKGIPDEILENLGYSIFTFGKPNGNGLGLVHAKEMISSWEGDLTITSKVGKGATVIIDLPIQDGHAKEAYVLT